MIEDKIKLITSREAVVEYLKINGISGNAKEKFLAIWDAAQSEEQVSEPELEVNVVKTSVVDDESIETKEE